MSSTGLASTAASAAASVAASVVASELAFGLASRSPSDQGEPLYDEEAEETSLNGGSLAEDLSAYDPPDETLRVTVTHDGRMTISLGSAASFELEKEFVAGSPEGAECLAPPLSAAASRDSDQSVARALLDPVSFNGGDQGGDCSFSGDSDKATFRALAPSISSYASESYSDLAVARELTRATAASSYSNSSDLAVARELAKAAAATSISTANSSELAYRALCASGPAPSSPELLLEKEEEGVDVEDKKRRSDSADSDYQVYRTLALKEEEVEKSGNILHLTLSPSAGAAVKLASSALAALSLLDLEAEPETLREEEVSVPDLQTEEKLVEEKESPRKHEEKGKSPSPASLIVAQVHSVDSAVHVDSSNEANTLSSTSSQAVPANPGCSPRHHPAESALSVVLDDGSQPPRPLATTGRVLRAHCRTRSCVG